MQMRYPGSKGLSLVEHWRRFNTTPNSVGVKGLSLTLRLNKFGIVLHYNTNEKGSVFDLVCEWRCCRRCRALSYKF